MAHPMLTGQFDEDEAREIASDIADEVQEQLGPAGTLTVKWAVEEAVVHAFGHKTEDEDESE